MCRREGRSAAGARCRRPRHCRRSRTAPANRARLLCTPLALPAASGACTTRWWAPAPTSSASTVSGLWLLVGGRGGCGWRAGRQGAASRAAGAQQNAVCVPRRAPAWHAACTCFRSRRPRSCRCPHIGLVSWSAAAVAQRRCAWTPRGRATWRTCSTTRATPTATRAPSGGCVGGRVGRRMGGWVGLMEGGSQRRTLASSPAATAGAARARAPPRPACALPLLQRPAASPICPVNAPTPACRSIGEGGGRVVDHVVIFAKRDIEVGGLIGGEWMGRLLGWQLCLAVGVRALWWQLCRPPARPPVRLPACWRRSTGRSTLTPAVPHCPVLPCPAGLGGAHLRLPLLRRRAAALQLRRRRLPRPRQPQGAGRRRGVGAARRPEALPAAAAEVAKAGAGPAAAAAAAAAAAGSVGRRGGAGASARGPAAAAGGGARRCSSAPAAAGAAVKCVCYYAGPSCSLAAL